MFQIRYALGGGFGGVERQDWEDYDCQTLEQAEQAAYELAKEEYDSYAGLHGIRSIEEIMEEEDCSEEDAESYYQEECDSWIEYEAREKP